ncbi:MAG: TRAP transporter small permease subunit, partial [Rhizobium leguminosarum]|nr:TRAP transporter small permease subunit [Rhizobium leguminosarum]
MATGEVHPIEQTTPDDRIAARALRLVEAVLGIAAALVLAVLLFMVLVTVCLRYFFSAGFIGAEDLGIWLQVGLIALGAPLSLNSALAMRLDVFVKMLPESLQKVTPIGADVFTVLSALILSFGGSEIMTMLGGVSPTLGVPEWIRFGFL